jgi:hypothetical protein
VLNSRTSPALRQEQEAGAGIIDQLLFANSQLSFWMLDLECLKMIIENCPMIIDQ